MSLARNIRFLRKRNDWSQEYVAQRLGYKSYTTIQKWEMGTSEPPLKKLKELADLFNADMHDLVNGDFEINANPLPSTPKGVKIPVLGRVAAGVPIEAIEEILDWEEIPESMARNGEYFALKIKGDSMEPRIQEGDVVIVRRQPDADSQDIVIALVNGADATCKRLIKYDHGLGLMSNNPLYEPLIFSHEEVDEMPVKILGKVVELRGKF